MIANLVSCIIPTFNGERFVGEAIESILGQKYTTIEIIWVDDGSKDGTQAIVRGFGDRVQYVHQENAGPATARNRGTRSAQGEFLAFLDSDDTWVQDKLRIQVAHLRNNSEHGFCVAHVQNFWEAELAEEQAQFRDHARSKPIPGYVTQALLVPTDAFNKVALFDSKLKHTSGTEWFMRAKSCRVVGHLLDDVLVMRRLHKDNRSRQFAGRSRDEYLDLVMGALKKKREGGRGGDGGEDPNRS